MTDKPYFRWVIAAASFLCVLAVWTPYSSFGVFVPRLTSDFGWERGTVTAVFGVIVVIGGPTGFLMGHLIDRYGPSKVMGFVMVICAASYVLASSAQELWQLYVYLGLLLGIGFGGSYVIPTSTAARWFQDNRGLAVGIVLSGQGVAYFIGPLIASALINNLGWRDAYVVLGTGLGVLGIVPALSLRNPPAIARPTPNGSRGAVASSSQPSSKPASPMSVRQVLLTPACQMLFMVWFLEAFIQMIFTIHVVPMVLDKGIDRLVAPGVLTVYGAGLLAGRILTGPLADWLGAKSVFALSTLMSTVAVVVVFFAQDLSLLYASALVFGFGMSGADNTYMKALPDIVGSRSLGTVTGGLSIGWRTGGAIGPAFAGFVFDATRVYTVPFGLGVLGLLASIWFFFAAVRQSLPQEEALEAS